LFLVQIVASITTPVWQLRMATTQPAEGDDEAGRNQTASKSLPMAAENSTHEVRLVSSLRRPRLCSSALTSYSLKDVQVFVKTKSGDLLMDAMEPFRRPRWDHVATEVGVSTATVSIVLRGNRASAANPGVAGPAKS
jgi:hypothetical protein